MAAVLEIEIKPRRGWQDLNFREIWAYRELFGYLVWRDISIRYKQTVLGSFWAVLQPLAGMLVFTFIFHRLAGIPSGGPPYPLFVYAGLLPWTFFANSVPIATNSLVGNQALISKVYFPRTLLPLSSISALLLDLLIGLVLLFALMAYYHCSPSLHLALLPLFLLGSFLAASGLGLILSTLNVYFRDVKHALPFAMQLGMFITPVLYPISYLPGGLRLPMAFNPVAGSVEGFRYALLGSPVSWSFMGTSLFCALLLFVAGLSVFRRMESRFADVI